MATTASDLHVDAGAIEGCLARIRNLVTGAIPGISVEVRGDDGPGGRIDLLALADGQPVSQSFVLKSECQRAFERDPATCRSIDQIACLWISVIRVKVQDAKSYRRVSSKLRKPSSEALTI